MPRVWTHGVWKVNPGRGDDFVAAWRELVPVGLRHGSGNPTLLRDRESPSIFHSLGSWPDIETVERFRAEAFPLIGEMGDLLESFDALTLDEVHPGD